MRMKKWRNCQSAGQSCVKHEREPIDGARAFNLQLFTPRAPFDCPPTTFPIKLHTERFQSSFRAIQLSTEQYASSSPAVSERYQRSVISCPPSCFRAVPGQLQSNFRAIANSTLLIDSVHIIINNKFIEVIINFNFQSNPFQ